jgi:hypothetical protein
MPTWEGRREASKTWAIKAALIMGVPLVVRNPLSFLPDSGVDNKVWIAHLESV